MSQKLEKLEQMTRDIEKDINRFYGHLARTNAMRNRDYMRGINDGYRKGYERGYELGIKEGFEERQVFHGDEDKK